MKPKRVEVNDKMQEGYVYFRTKPMGRTFRPGFAPELTPKQMLELGVFGGKYMTDCRKEFPASWFKRAKLSPDRACASLNYFGVNASQPLSEWQRKGWIYPDDPRGWFQWYCGYYCGRRSQDDLCQIARWRAVRHHVAQLKKTVNFAISIAVAVSARHCFTGRSIRERSDHPDLSEKQERRNLLKVFYVPVFLISIENLNPISV
jgi:hypothetical protein